MTDDDDGLLKALACLPLVEPDMDWERRVRARCRSTISKRASRRVRARRNRRGARLIYLAAAVILCAYSAAILAEVVRLVSSVYGRL